MFDNPIDSIPKAWNTIKEVVEFILIPIKWLKTKSPLEIRWKEPKPFLAVIPSPWQQHGWEYGKDNAGKKVVIIRTHWEITNTLKYNLTTMSIRMTNPHITPGSWMTKDTDSQYSGHYGLKRGYTTDLSITFCLPSKKIPNKDSIIKINIEITDVIGNIHTLNKVEVQPHKIPNKKRGEKLKKEDMSKIVSSVEKQVASALLNEIKQYNHNGRPSGGLGSVTWPRGTLEYSTANEPMQFLFPESNPSHVTSPSAEAISNLYSSSNPSNQVKLISALLSRVDKTSEYRDVAYLVGLCLFDIGKLHRIFDIANKKLKGDKAHGFSDLLRIIDLLLGFRYQEFNDKLLENIEDFVYPLKDHTFSIKERINAIRLSRLKHIDELAS